MPFLGRRGCRLRVIKAFKEISLEKPSTKLSTKNSRETPAIGAEMHPHKSSCDLPEKIKPKSRRWSAKEKTSDGRFLFCLVFVRHRLRQSLSFALLFNVKNPLDGLAARALAVESVGPEENSLSKAQGGKNVAQNHSLPLSLPLINWYIFLHLHRAILGPGHLLCSGKLVWEHC